MERPPASSMLWMFGILLVLALAFLGIGIYIAALDRGTTLLAAGVLSFLVVFSLFLLTRSVEQARRSADQCYQAQTTLLEERLQQLAVVLNLVSEQQLLSDRAKAVAFREKDRDVIRRAVQEEISRGDFEAAMSLANDLELAFGYRQEAERLRQEIAAKREEAVRKQIMEGIAVIDRHTRGEVWSDALVEAEKLMQRFPDHELVRNLPAEIDARRQAHKKQLLEAWHDANTRNDVDSSIELMKKLDSYLTRDEVEAMQDSARHVLKEKLNMLRQQFTAAVQEHKWSEALRLGDIVVRDFPNTRIATEVREKLDALRRRASAPEEAKV